MKAWKKFAVIALALGLTAGVAACGGGDGGNSSSSSDSSSSVPATQPEQLNEFQMNAAIQALYTAENVKVEMNGVWVESGMELESSTIFQVANGKTYGVNTMVGEFETYVSYVYKGEVDGTLYQWTKENDEAWDCISLSENFEYEASVETLLSEQMGYINYTYFEYNATTGMHIFSNWGVNEMHVKVVDGKIVEYKIYDANTASAGELLETCTITYGNATVGELPPVTAE